MADVPVDQPVLRDRREEFVGREEFVQFFREAVRLDSPKPLLFFHGVGGIGKSRLLWELQHIAAEELAMHCIYVNLQNNEYSDWIALAKRIVSEFSDDDFRKTKYVAAAVNRSFAHEGASSMGASLGDLAGQAIGVAIQSQSPEFMSLPLSDILAQAARFCGGWVAELLAGRERLGEEWLPLLRQIFVEEYAEICRDKLDESGQRGHVLFLDAHEYVHQKGTDHLILWLCEALAEVAVVVIGGRDKPHWTDDATVVRVLRVTDDGIVLDQRAFREEGQRVLAGGRFHAVKLLPLESSAVGKYLRIRGVTDDATQSRVMDLTRGHPLFMEIACDIVLARRAAQAFDSADDIPSPPSDTLPEHEYNEQVADILTERFLGRTGLTSDQQDVLRTLGICRSFDQKLIAALRPDWDEAMVHAFYDRVRDSSLVVDRTSDRPRIHDDIRDAIRRSFAPRDDLWKERNQKLVDYHTAEENGPGILYHAYQIDNMEGSKLAFTWADKWLGDFNFSNAFNLLQDFASFARPFRADVEAKTRAGILVEISYRLSRISPHLFETSLTIARAVSQEALKVCPREYDAETWATTQNNLGNLYAELPAKSPEEQEHNLHEAITCLEKALEVYTKDNYPQEWASVHGNLGNRYCDLPYKNPEQREHNLKKAIEHDQYSLEVFHKDQHPSDWATAMNNLGNRYAQLPSADTEVERRNLLFAVECYQGALEVRLKKGCNEDSADTMLNLGNVYVMLSSNDDPEQKQNMEKSEFCYQGALEVLRRDRYPYKWAVVRFNLGNLYARCLATNAEERRQNLQKAIVCYCETLEIARPNRYPLFHSKVIEVMALVVAKLKSI